jgi:mannose-6-phosphate isomerase-like protein (cupin superfamily)
MEILKPWGKEVIWAATDGYCGKFLHINKGHRLSLQFHEEKEETIFVLKGSITLEIGDSIKNIKTLSLKEKESYYIKPMAIHRFSSPECDSILIEVSTSQLNDVIRIEDDYGRVE